MLQTYRVLGLCKAGPYYFEYPLQPSNLYLISQVPYSNGPVVTGRNEDVFERVSCQTPDPSLSVSVDHSVGCSVLFSNLYYLSIFGSHQDLTLDRYG